ncbi:MAG: baseplate assembly protein [Desulfobacteraceae bacterium]|nr:baseplate assembly protein [Desulfobacteraceae bacterium]
MEDIDLKALLKRVVELVMPDLRSYYRVVRKARVVKTYASNSQYWADVQPLRNDDSIDDTEPVIPKVEIPVIWAGPDRGVVCPPEKGTYCDLEYYDGDPNFPRISNFRWHGGKAPAVEIGGLTIQRETGTHIKIDFENNIIHVTPADKQNTIGKNKAENIGKNWTVEVGGHAKIKATGTATIEAPQINMIGNMTSGGAGGATGTASEKCNKTQTGNFTLIGNFNVTGNIHATGTIIDEDGNTANHSGH